MLISPQNMEIENIYTQLLGSNNRAIAICSANTGEGVSSLALALAQRNLLAGQSTLLVDFNLYNPSLINLLASDESMLQTSQFGTPQLVTAQNQSIALTGITVPTRRDQIIKLRRPGVLEQYIIEWQKTFDTIIFDTSPINRVNARNIPAERVTAACGGVLLVVLAGRTTEAMVFSATEKLTMAGASLLACVYNDRDNPPLKSELLRELHRLEPYFSGPAQRIKKWIQNSHLLTLEI